MNERKPPALGVAPAARGDRTAPTASSPPGPSVPSAASPRAARPVSAAEANPHRAPSKFGAAADGWDAYNSWLDRVRQPTPPSRQAVIAKSLYSLSCYKNWADKARGAFLAGAPVPPRAKVK